MDIDQIKKGIREYVWREMERLNIARFPRPVYGRIPNFVGAKQAAEKLRGLREWEFADIIFVNPDAPQSAVRAFGLLDGKKVVMASPRIKRGFILLNPNKILLNNYWKLVTIRNALRWGEVIHPSKINVDIKVIGSVAVDKEGGRVGKGHGYSDLEFAILMEYDAIDETTPIITTVHDIQIVQNIPMADNDLPVDIIVTPKTVIRTYTKYKKPSGIIWDKLTKEEIEKIPLLKELLNKKS